MESFLEDVAVILAVPDGSAPLRIAWRAAISAAKSILRVLNQALGPQKAFCGHRRKESAVVLSCTGLKQAGLKNRSSGKECTF